MLTVFSKCKKVSDKDVKKLAEKYVKEIKAEYKDEKVNVQAVCDGKNVVNIRNGACALRSVNLGFF